MADYSSPSSAMTEKEPIVFVIDDDEGIRVALARLLRSVGLKVQCFGSTQEFLRSERPDAPGCLVLDVRLPGLSGLDLQRELLEAVQLGIERDRALRADADLVSALRERFESLTTREREVMALAVTGRLNKQIAGDLGVSEITVKGHRGQVMRKMGARSVAELVRMADRLGVAREKL